MGNPPTISVCMVTYQHEKYIAEAVRSVLNQTFSNFELIIVNDGSIDGTAAKIAEFTDPRIRLINQSNQGPGTATNTAIRAARGQYIALFSGDDVCHPARLRIQLDATADQPRLLVFSGVDFIDEYGSPVVGEHFASALFAGDPPTRAQTLARLFHHGNFLNGVTTFGPREVFAAESYDPTLLQLQDFDLWVRLVKTCDIRVLNEKLVNYRIRSSGANLSAPSADAVTRSANEHYIILRRFFDGIATPLFREAFADRLINPDFSTDEEFECEKAFLYARSLLPMARAIGVERFHALMNDVQSAETLRHRYQFLAKEFFELLRVTDSFNLLGGHASTLFLDTGDGWVAGQEVRVPINIHADEFALRFELPPSISLKAVRWDPLEGRPCRISLESVTCLNADGSANQPEVTDLDSNGTRLGPNEFELNTTDPSIWFPVNEGTTQIIIRGRWDFDYLMETVVSLRQEVDELQAALEEANQSGTARLLKFARGAARRLKAG